MVTIPNPNAQWWEMKAFDSARPRLTETGQTNKPRWYVYDAPLAAHFFGDCQLKTMARVRARENIPGTQ